MSEDGDDTDTRTGIFSPQLRDMRSAFCLLAGFLFLFGSLYSLTSYASGMFAGGVFLGFLVGIGLGPCLYAVTTGYRLLALTAPSAGVVMFAVGWWSVFDESTFLIGTLIGFGTMFGLSLSSRWLLRPLGFGASPPQEMPDDIKGSLKVFSRLLVLLGVALLLGFFMSFVLRSVLAAAQIDSTRRILGWYIFGVAAVVCVWAAIRFPRPMCELAAEMIHAVFYHVRSRGYGRYCQPPFGPVLVIANHAAWFDPLFVAIVLNRPTTPMMTASFYDVWFLKPILKHVFGVIRVPEVAVKHEAPELDAAIAALDRGECVLIHPEGFLRRKEEVPLRRFGRGVWHILAARPGTPVLPCWVEGSWGSYFSWKGGPPTKNKKIDFRRPIDVALGEPEVVPADVLADQLRTRIYLMNQVLAARQLLGLPPLPKFDLPAADDTEQVTQAE